MGVKSIIDIDINDTAFARFKRQWDQYENALKSSPAEWAKVTKAIGAGRAGFDQLVKQQIAVQARTKLIAEAEKEAARRTMTMADKWREMSRSASSVAGSVREITSSILKWSAITGTVSGLLGIGGLFGLNRLAENVSGGRRSSMGQDLSYGQQRSFGLNFGRLVDPSSFLSSVSEARGDVTRRVGFYGAGMNDRDLQGNTAEVGVKLLDSLRTLAKNTDPRFYAQTLQSRGLSQFVTIEDFRRLATTGDSEYKTLRGNFNKNVGGLDLPSQTQRAWQDFSTQLSRAGNQIENTFVRGLLPLVPGLEKLSEGVEKTIRTFLGSDTVKNWMEKIGGGLESMAKYIGTPEFERNVEGFVKGIGKIASAVGGFVNWVGADTRFGPEGNPAWDESQKRVQEKRERLKGWFGMSTRNNPGNLRNSSGVGFQTFESEDEGIRAMGRQLGRYFNRDKLDTISGIVSKYAPRNENNTDAYIKAVGTRTGYGADQKLNLNDPEVMARLISAMTKQENHKSNFTPSGVKVIIENNTGGNSITTTNQLKGQN